MSSVSDIKDQLASILGEVDGINRALDYMPRFFDTNNMIGIFYDGATFEPAELSSHWAHYKFTITAFIYMFDETSIQQTQETLGEDLLSALRAKPSLNQTCLKYSIEEIRNDYVRAGNGNVYATIEITIVADKEEDD
ncbi:MAG: hypothetical protein PVJ67_04245 [Candidatus Pacearchaeota archaeon]|jgi:hypothetical protein